MNRVIAYIDGNNLHYRTRDLNKPHLLWCDVKELVKGFLKDGDSLESVKYYTARPFVKPPKIPPLIPNTENAEWRWVRHTKALKSIGVEICEGITTGKKNYIDLDELLSHDAMQRTVSNDNLKMVLSSRLLRAYLSQSKNEFICESHGEKQTDVHLATDLVGNSYQNAYDTAFVVSGDSDLLPAIAHVLNNHPSLKIKVISPSRQPFKEVNKLKNRYPNRLDIEHIGQKALEVAQLPDSVPLKNGKFLTRPAKYT